MPIGIGKQLLPQELYFAMVGLLKNHPESFDLVKDIKNSAVIFRDKISNQLVVMYYPGIDGQVSFKDRGKPLSEIVEAVAKELEGNSEGITAQDFQLARKIVPVGISSKNHFILATIENNIYSSYDSRDNRFHRINESGVRSAFLGNHPFIPKIATINKPIRSGHQSALNSWRCGYDVYETFKRMFGFPVPQERSSISMSTIQEINRNISTTAPCYDFVMMSASSQNDLELDEEDFTSVENELEVAEPIPLHNQILQPTDVQLSVNKLLAEYDEKSFFNTGSNKMVRKYLMYLLNHLRHYAQDIKPDLPCETVWNEKPVKDLLKQYFPEVREDCRREYSFLNFGKA